MLRAFPAVVIENLQPLIDGGRYPVKRVIGEDLVVEADVFKDGHDVVSASLKWRVVGESRWHETSMTHIDNDRWRGACTVYRPAARTAAWYEFFPRSAEGRADRGSTLREALPRVDAAKAMGFDVIYFPPIHPIGHTN